MTDIKMTDEVDQIISENEELKLRLKEAEETIDAIRNGEVDAIVVNGKEGEVIYSLQTAETPYRVILEEMNQGALIVSENGMILYCNRRFSELLTIPQARLTCSKITELIDPSELATFKKLFREGLRKKTSGVTTFVSSAEKRIHAQISIAALPQNLGGDISIVVSDITEIKDYQILLEEMVEKRAADLKEANRKLSEDVVTLLRKERTIKAVANKYRELYSRLRQSEQMYMNLVQGANSIIMEADQNGYIKFMNNYGLSFFGYTEEEIIGHHVIGTTIPVKDSTGQNLSVMAEKIIANPSDYPVNEHENMRKDGSLVWISWTNNSINDRNGNHVGILAIGNDISAFKKAEKAFLESESRFKTIVETASEGVITTDTEGVITYANEKFTELFGYESTEVLGKSALYFVFEEDSEKVVNARTGNLYKTGHGEFRFRRKDGSALWASYNVSALRDSNGEIIGNLGMVTDITDRKTAEEILYRSEERFRTAFENGAVPMALATLKGEFFRVNQAFCALTGYEVNELTQMTFVQLTHQDDRMKNIDGFNKLLTGELSSFRMEKRYICKNGEVKWVDMSTAPVRDKAGKIDYMVTHIQDINERKKAENELKRFDEKLNIALESGHIGIWELSLRDNTVTWDTRMEEMFELEPGSFRGNTTAFYEFINDEDLPHFLKTLNNSIKTGEMFETVFRTCLKDGNSKYILAKALIYKDENGIPSDLTGICFDVTGMKEGAEKAIMKLNDELLRSNRELESFAYVASHDLQEPLRMVASFTQMLSQRYGDKLDQDAQDYIKFAVDGAKRMYDLINGLLTYSRIQTKGKEFSEVDMEYIFSRVTNNLGLMIKEKSARVSKNNLPKVFADENQMLQLVQNLVENAIKFSTKKKPSVIITANDRGDSFLFSVKDNGIGIEPQYFERIFKIFQQLISKDEYEGTGIGLAICKRIVERHRGEIWVKSKPGKGSEFFFTIPKKLV